MKIQTPKILENLNFLPKVTNITLDCTNKESISIQSNFQLNVKYSDKKFAWFLDPKVVKLLNLVITFSFNEQLTNKLSNDSKSFLYTGIPSNLFDKNDYIQIEDKFSNLNSDTARTVDASGQILLSTSFQKLIKLTTKPSHLTVFTAIHIDNNTIADSFGVNLNSFKTVGTFSSESFIINDKYVSGKVNDLTILREKEKFQFNSQEFFKFLQNSSLVQKIIKKNPGEVSFSPLYHSINDEQQVSCVFFINLEKLFQFKSKFPTFFQNEQFSQNFFSLESNYSPFHIKLVRYNNSKKYDVLYDGNFSKFITNEDVKITNIDLGDKKMFCLSFLDKTSQKLNTDYQYEIELSFIDETVNFLSDIGIVTDFEIKNIQQIINIAKYKNYYQISTNSFSIEFEKELGRNNLSIKDCIINTAKILSQFKEFDEKTINSIITLSKSKYFNFDILDSIFDILIFVRSQIGEIQKRTLLSNSNTIIVSNKFLQTVSLQQTNVSKIKLFPTDNIFSLSSISSQNFKQRVESEILKYYNVNDIIHSSKNTLMTAHSLRGKYIDIIQDSVTVNAIDFQKYNNFLIDFYYEKMFNGEFKSVSNIDKLKIILEGNGLDLTDITASNDVEFENLLLEIFLRCIVIKDFKQFDYKNVDPKSLQTKVSLISEEKVPIGIRSLMNSLSNKSSLPRNDEAVTRDALSDVKKVFGMYMNFKNVFKIQYFDTEEFSWKDFDSNNFVNNKNFICRYIQYFDEIADVNSNDKLQFQNVDEIFVFINDKVAESVDKNSILNLVPDAESIYAIYPFGSRVYGNYSDLSDYDFILLYNKTPATEQLIRDKYTFNMTTPAQFQFDLQEHIPYALECFFLDPTSVIVSPNKPFNFNLNFTKLEESFIPKMDKEFALFKQRFNTSDFVRGKKSLFHSMRVGLYGLQILKYGKIQDYSEANFLWESISSYSSSDFVFYENKFLPIFNKIKNDFLSRKEDFSVLEIYKMLN